MLAPNPAATPERLEQIKRSHKKYVRERARMEFTLRRAATSQPEDPNDLPEEGSSVE